MHCAGANRQQEYYSGNEAVWSLMSQVAMHETAHSLHFSKQTLRGHRYVAVFAGPRQDPGNHEPGCIGDCHFPGTFFRLVLPQVLMQMCT